MGCVPGDARCSNAEKPQVTRQIAEPFDMMDREVSAGDFQAYAAATGRQAPRQPEWYANASHPVVNVTWDEAQSYCEWLGGRLPTEEEWEYAARGGLDGRLFPWGDEYQERANGRAPAVGGNPTGDPWLFTAPVASFEPNGFGLYDMAGNVWEWTASRHRPTHDLDAVEGGYDQRTIKGGSWDNSPPKLRASERAALSRSGRHNLYVGFRCLRPALASAGGSSTR
jgi:formylglycine-generating enzyme required for sulfatase activity